MDVILSLIRLVRGKHPEIQLVLDYTDDVAERQIMKVPPKKVDVA